MKTMYRIELNTTDTMFTDMVMMAACSNGGDFIPLDKIADAADWICKKYPTTGKVHSVNRIGETVLTIDKGMENILVITQVEIMEVPTLSAYENTRGILNPDLHECIN